MENSKSREKSKSSIVVFLLSVLIFLLFLILGVLIYALMGAKDMQDDYLVRLENGDVASVELLDSDKYYREDEIVFAVGEEKDSQCYARGVITKKETLENGTLRFTVESDGKLVVVTSERIIGLFIKKIPAIMFTLSDKMSRETLDVLEPSSNIGFSGEYSKPGDTDNEQDDSNDIPELDKEYAVYLYELFHCGNTALPYFAFEKLGRIDYSDVCPYDIGNGYEAYSVVGVDSLNDMANALSKYFSRELIFAQFMGGWELVNDSMYFISGVDMNGRFHFEYPVFDSLTRTGAGEYVLSVKYYMYHDDSFEWEDKYIYSYTNGGYILKDIELDPESVTNTYLGYNVDYPELTAEDAIEYFELTLYPILHGWLEEFDLLDYSDCYVYDQIYEGYSYKYECYSCKNVGDSYNVDDVALLLSDYMPMQLVYDNCINLEINTGHTIEHNGKLYFIPNLGFGLPPIGFGSGRTEIIKEAEGVYTVKSYMRDPGREKEIKGVFVYLHDHYAMISYEEIGEWIPFV